MTNTTMSYSENIALDSNGMDTGNDNSVSLDILPLLQMIKHAQGAAPTNVSGQLLGLDNKNNLEVTYSYGMPISEGDLQLINKTEFQERMINCLHKTNIDGDVVGWYTSTFLNSFCTLQMILSQYEYQVALGNNTIVVVIDAFELSRGKLSIKAYRLTTSFMTMFKEDKINMEDIRNNKFDSTMIFEEVPLRLCVNELALALLHQCGLSSMIHNEIPASEKNMEQLVESLDAVINERRDYVYGVRQASKQKQLQSNWMSAREEENRMRGEMGDSLLPDMDLDDPVFKQVVLNDRIDPLVGYCALKDFCGRLNNAATNDTMVLKEMN